MALAQHSFPPRSNPARPCSSASVNDFVKSLNPENTISSRSPCLAHYTAFKTPPTQSTAVQVFQPHIYRGGQLTRGGAAALPVHFLQRRPYHHLHQQEWIRQFCTLERQCGSKFTSGVCACSQCTRQFDFCLVDPSGLLATRHWFQNAVCDGEFKRLPS